MNPRQAAIPISTYRLQFSSRFTFTDASQLVQYLSNLGISHCYASPIWQSKSNQGYAIVDHSKLNSEIGSEDQFALFHQTLQENQLGLICDVVPNHMFIVDSRNKWWFDILENGRASEFAGYFDIDWQPLRNTLANKILLPLLEHHYNESLEQQEMKVVYSNEAFFIELKDIARLPTDPKSYLLILKPLIKKLEKSIKADDPDLIELKSIVTALAHLPPTTEADKDKISERLREKEIIKSRLQTLLLNNKQIFDQLNRSLIALNGKKGNPKSFNLLETFLNKQAYRLCFWRMANEEINYRRFFDFFELAGIRTERDEVFQTTHHLLLQLIKKGWVDGVRIDHIDGLWDPASYLQQLVTQCNQNKNEGACYFVVEKILIGKERLNREWPIQGTVGYDFLNQLNGLFVSQQNRNSIFEIYREFSGMSSDIIDQLFLCKRLILETSLLSELSVLSRHLLRLTEQHRSSFDYTYEGLKTALRDVIACFPVYRSYISPKEHTVNENDRSNLLKAIVQAKRRNPTLELSLFDFIRHILLLEHPMNLIPNQIEERENFIHRFQQLTGPVMAKGIEDTFSYRFYPLPSLNEVGSNPTEFGISVEEFHGLSIDRLTEWPHSMLTTSTHDTKRGEDVRARINVISEMPAEWQSAIIRWSQLNQKEKIQNDIQLIPDANEEYLLYATLIGTWPFKPMSEIEYQHYVERIQEYIRKAIKEAKLHTSWINPNTEYENDVHTFIQNTLNPENQFLSDFKPFVKKISSAGVLNSLSQVLIKLTSPGMPDIYQGNELWDFSLVDPDNRRPIDFPTRIHLMNTLKGEPNPTLTTELMQNFEDGKIKLYITMRTLQVRRSNVEIFKSGDYLPLMSKGLRENHIIAYARKQKNKFFLVIVGRFFSTLMTDESPIIPSQTWKKTALKLPIECKEMTFKDLFTGRRLYPKINGESVYLDMEEVFSHLTIAFLEGTEQ